MNSAYTDAIARLLGDWSTTVNGYSILFRVLLSALFAAIIGWERSTKRHSAGLRTFILVSLASTIAMLIDLSLMSAGSLSFAAVSAATVVGGAMISGNSILFNSKSQIRGLTTSAGLWASSLIGLAAGAGYYTLTVASFLLLLCIISLLPALEKYLKDHSNHFEVHLELKNRANLQDFVTTVRKLDIRIDDIELNPAYANSGLSVYSISLSINNETLKKYRSHAEIIEALKSLDYISHIEEMN